MSTTRSEPIMSNAIQHYIEAVHTPDIIVTVSDVVGSHQFTMTHDEIIADLRGLLSTAKDERRVILNTAIGHVESDQATGSSLAAWPEMRTLVNLGLTWALGSEIVAHAEVTTAWPVI